MEEREEKREEKRVSTMIVFMISVLHTGVEDKAVNVGRGEEERRRRGERKGVGGDVKERVDGDVLRESGEERGERRAI